MDIAIDKETVAAPEPWPQEGLESVERCPVCESTERKLLHKDLRDGVFFCAPGTWNLYLCKHCGSAYLDPRPTPGTVGLAYSRYFTHEIDTQRPTEDLSTLRRFRRALANSYRNSSFGTDFQPSNPLGSWVIKVFPKQRAILDAEIRHLSKVNPTQTLLDVGCGNGAFLESAASMGWKIEGVDFDKKAVQVARRRGFIVHQGRIEDIPDRAGYYDVVTLSHIIEHVHDPLALLKGCLQLLKPGGLLWLATPNLESAGHVYYGRHWRGLEPPRHLVLFTWASLETLVIQAGFMNVQAAPWQPLANHLYSASEAISQGRDPYGKANDSLSLRWRAWRADRKAKKSLTSREFITFFARKSQ